MINMNNFIKFLLSSCIYILIFGIINILYILIYNKLISNDNFIMIIFLLIIGYVSNIINKYCN